MPMPNPTPQQQGGATSTTTPRNPTVVQNSVSSINSVTTQNNAQQKIAEILSNISARLDNVTNLRTQTQSAVYDSFGNNFITRGATQITDEIFDTVSSLFESKQESTEDNILKELKKHTETLKQLLDKSDNFDELIDLNDESLKTHQLILDRLDKSALENHEFYNENITFLEDQKKLSEKNLEMLHNVLVHLSKTNETDTGKPSFKKAITSPPHTVGKNIAIVDPNTIDIDLPLDDPSPIKKSVTDDNNVSDVTENSKDKKEISLLTSMSNTLLDMSKHIKKFFADQSLSTQETELESGRVVKNSKASTDTKIVNALPDTSFFGKVISGIIGGLTTLVAFFSSDKIKMFLDILSKLKNIIPSIPMPGGRPPISIPTPGSPVPGKPPTPSKTPPVPTDSKTAKLGAKLLEYGKQGAAFAGRWAVPAAIATGIGMFGGTMIDEVAKDAGMGNKIVDEKQDSENWERMGILEKAQSGIARGIESVGEFLNLKNMMNDARAERIEKETDYLDEKMREIEEKQKDIDAEMKSRMSSHSQAAPAQQAPTTINNNSTVMPIRESVKNTDDSFNRYLASVLG